MRKTTLFLCALLLSVRCAVAAPSDESLHELFKLMNSESLMESVYATVESSMRESMAQATAGKAFTPEQARVLELAPARLAGMLRQELSWERQLPVQMEIYRQSFEQAEIDGLIAFYRSPAGQAFVAKMPFVTRRAMEAMQLQLRQLAPKLDATLRQTLIEAGLKPPQ